MLKFLKLNNLDNLELRQVGELQAALQAAGWPDDVKLSWRVGDSPHIKLRRGLELCSDSLGKFDLWRNDHEAVRYGLTLDEAVAMLRGER